MDKRNSKQTLLDHIDSLNKKIELIYDTGMEGISYVGLANYADRERAAIRKLDIAMYGSEQPGNCAIETKYIEVER